MSFSHVSEDDKGRSVLVKYNGVHPAHLVAGLIHTPDAPDASDEAVMEVIADVWTLMNTKMSYINYYELAMASGRTSLANRIFFTYNAFYLNSSVEATKRKALIVMEARKNMVAKP